MRSTNLKVALSGIVIVGGSAVLNPSANADIVGMGFSAPAFLGHANVPSAASCFTEQWGAVKNTCSGFQLWELGLVTNVANNNFQPLFQTTPNNTGHSIQCAVTATDASSTVSFNSGWVWNVSTSNGEIGPIGSSGVTVPAGAFGVPGALLGVCNMGPNTSWNTISW